MISVVQHGVKPPELVGRKYRAMRVRLDPETTGALCLDEMKSLEAGEELSAGTAGPLQLLVSGIAGEVRLLGDGRRQIVTLRFPGDFVSPSEGEQLVALTRARLVDGSALMARLADPAEVNQSLRLGWLAAARVDQAMLRDHVVRLGRMSAFERMAHLLLEAHERLAQMGLAAGANFHFPLTQETMSDVVGLSVVHLNRTLQTLRRSGLISLRQGYVTLLNRPELVEVASYVSRFPAAWRASPPFAAPTSIAV